MKDFFGRMLGLPSERFAVASLPRHATIAAYPFAAQLASEPDLLGGSAKGELRGTCPICGMQTLFERFTDNLRESGFCSSCGSFNRQRQIAHVLRKRSGLPVGTALSVPAGRVVYNTETTGAVHKSLSGNPNYFCSEYFGEEYAPGEFVDGRRHEDLQRLSFEDEALDLVLSSDVLEHMPDPYLAHREIFRALKPGGRHIFTVPFDCQAPLDDRRAALVEGQIVYLADKQFHGDPVRPDQGILVWTIFGLEMLVQLARIGFQPAAWNLYEPEEGIVGPYSLVFEAFKPLGR
ncbi:MULTISPECIES: methyltransferase domain-containing protein [unclassified Variovorax]|uniref:methyltransferase domain-containing protein n=1 Tax=unclassified Variovorax TaxID=663243 RepID=UPI003ECF81AB